MKGLAISIACIILLYIIYFRFFFMHWGARVSETKKAYTGDSIVEIPDYANTIAITIKKPPRDIWPWVAQMGVNKAGFYSYTWLENIFGCNLHNADKIHAEWQNPAVGDYEPVCEQAEKNKMPGWRISTIIPNKAFIYRSSVDSSWTMGFYIDSIDEKRSRLITRMRYTSSGKFWDRFIDKIWLEWAHCIMQKGSINGIKKRAEKKNLSAD